MAKKTFKGRPLLPGDLTGEALVSRQAFNTTGSYLKNMFAGVTDSAPCTDSANEELYEKDLSGAIICTTQTVGSTLGGGALMGVNELGVGPKAMLFAWHIDSVSAAGLFIDDIWNGRRVITIDNLGDEFLETVKTGDPIAIHSDGTVEVG
ncbi:MAG: aconitase X swivel domain-containing protein [Planctomycetota bacterium]|jgi:predicted aconitase with swiveling domain